MGVIKNKIFSDFQICDKMDIMDNNKIEFESQPLYETDNMGREKFWEDLGRPDDSLTLKIFKEECCDNCSCKN